MTVTGASSSDGSFLPTNGCTGPVAPGASCTVGVVFDPATRGAKSGTVSVTTDGGTRTVAVSGTGLQSEIGSANAVSFGEVGVTRTKRDVVAVTNGGNAPLDLTGIALGGADADQFGTDAPTTNACTTTVAIAQGGTCEVAVAFRPTTRGTKTATLTLSRADGPPKSITLTGSGGDVTRPRVTTRTPAPRANAVSPRSNVVARFSEAVQGVTGRTFVLTNLSNGRRVRAAVRNPSATRSVLNPRANLPRGTRFRASVIGGRSAVQDLNGQTLRTTRWVFRTR